MLQYAYRRSGPGAFEDTISVRILKVNSDASKDVAIDYLTGDRKVRFPELDHFHGNPLFMVALERDVTVMHEAVGLSAAYLRNRLRDGFFDAPVTTGTTTLPDGSAAAATIVTVQPFVHLERLARIPSLQAKTYRFVLAASVPGGLAEIGIDTPADPALGAPALSETIIFTGVTP